MNIWCIIFKKLINIYLDRKLINFLSINIRESDYIEQSIAETIYFLSIQFK